MEGKIQMKCPHCQSDNENGAVRCASCGADLGGAKQAAAGLKAVTVGGRVIGKKAREARLKEIVDPKLIVSDQVYNGVIGVVLLWGLLVNVLLCYFAGDFARSIPPIPFTIGYVVLAFAGIIIAGKSQTPWVSFLGYNMVVLPFGLVIASLVAEYVDYYAVDIVYDAFLYTMIIAVGITGAALAFPNFFAKIGGALLGCLFGVLILEIVLLLLGKDQVVTDWIVAGVFSLYIGFDVWRSQQFPKTVDNAVDCALDIYLDLANLFIRLLSILARKDD